MLNCWRSIGAEPVASAALAVCDMRTVSPDELIAARLGEHSLQVYMSEPSPHHRWHYFPGMSKDELLLIKTYDSAQRPFRPTLHTAFEPGEGQGGAPRRSCEARLLLVFPPPERVKL